MTKKWWWRLRYNWYAWRLGWPWGVASWVEDHNLNYEEHPHDAFYDDWAE